MKELQVYKSKSIEENLVVMASTVKGGSSINENKEEYELLDSKDVTKKKKELRLGIAYVARSEKNTALAIQSKAVAKKQNITLSSQEVQLLSQSLSTHLGDFTEIISGSKKYGEMVSTYAHAVIIRTLLSKLDDSSDK